MGANPIAATIEYYQKESGLTPWFFLSLKFKNKKYLTNNIYYVYNKYVSNIANGKQHTLLLKIVIHPRAKTYNNL